MLASIVPVTGLLRVIKSKTTSTPVEIPESFAMVTIPTAVPKPVIVVPVAMIPAPLLNWSPYTSTPKLNDVIIEVSSPGIDRKLANIEDYKKFMGYFVKLKLKKPIERKKNIAGKLVEIINSKKILIEIKEVLIEIELENIEKGKLDINQFFN